MSSEAPESTTASIPAPPLTAAEPGAAPKSGARTAVSIGTVAAATLAKGKTGLLLLKALPFGKFLLTSGSMFVSMLAYASRGGWPFAIGFVLLILLHELGHGWALRRAGIRSSWPVFIPFFGAMISMQGRPQHPCVEAEIAYAGPIAGTLASLLCAGAALLLHNQFLLTLAYTGFFLNLFNLVPFGFLDGGRVARVISRRAWIVGALLLGLLFLQAASPQLLLIAVLGGMHALRSARDPDLELVTDAQRRSWSFRYFGLCLFLGTCTLLTHRLLVAQG
jgi:Zn-dependent protease